VLSKQPELLTYTHDVKWFISYEELADIMDDKLDDILYEADLVLKHQFDILGTGLKDWGDPIQWNIDMKSGRIWSKKYYKKLFLSKLTGINGSDVKIPWELSRFQHLIVLIRAYCLTKDEKYALESVKQINKWIESNPPFYGVNWTCSMEVAIRACNWIWAWWAFRNNPAWTDEFNQKFFKSMWQHGWYIENNLEDKGGIRTNHYLANIVGLLFIGIMFPQFKDAKSWKDFGIKELIRCTEEMVYPDGVSFENSTAYHCLVLEFFTYSAILCQRNGVDLPREFWVRLERMFDFVLYCTNLKGCLPMIGDADDGRFFKLSKYYRWNRWDFRYLLAIGASLFKRSDLREKSDSFSDEALLIFGERGRQGYKKIQRKTVAKKSKAFKEGGFYVFSSSDEFIKCIVRFGSLSKNGFAWHAHCDTLSFVLYIDQKPIIVDPGTYSYTGKPEWRNKFRSTEYHNTIKIDQREMFEIPSNDLFIIKSYQKAPKLIRWVEDNNKVFFQGEHYWYSKQGEDVIHRREFTLNKENQFLFIKDSILSSKAHELEYFLHFHPDIRLEVFDDRLSLNTPKGNKVCIIKFNKIRNMEIIDSWYSEQYNKKKKSRSLLLHPFGHTLYTSIYL